MNRVENYKLLIRNLRKKQNEKLTIRTTANIVKYPKICESVHISKTIQSNNSK